MRSWRIALTAAALALAPAAARADEASDARAAEIRKRGDEAIVAITRQLQLSVRSGDAIGRFGGDEFAVIMSQTAAESAIAVMSRGRVRDVRPTRDWTEESIMAAAISVEE